MRKMRRCHLLVVFGFLCSFLLITLWMVGNGDGMLYRVAAAPILFFGGFGGNNTNGIECYYDEHRNTLAEITTVNPAKSNSIFFHETSCASSKANKIILTPRQACAVESAAKMNPNSEVYLLFTSPISLGNDTTVQWTGVVKELLKYSNVRVMHLNFEQYFVGTPLEEWYHGGALKASRWPRSHASDVLRFLTLWKYGGTYLDLDVVVTRSLQGLHNFAGAESGLDVAAGVLNLAADGTGHELAEACLEDLRTEFRGDDWGNNGPGVITRVLKRTCKGKLIRDMTPEHCQGFTVYPPESFYPIPWRQWRLYFDEGSSNKTMARLANSIAIHVWNKFSITENVIVGSKQPYGLIAQKFCPRIYSHSGPTF